jgi:hypothetical protein
MGNKTNSKNDITHFDLQEWKEIGLHREISKILQHNNNPTQAELTTIPFNPQFHIDK